MIGLEVARLGVVRVEVRVVGGVGLEVGAGGGDIEGGHTPGQHQHRHHQLGPHLVSGGTWSRSRSREGVGEMVVPAGDKIRYINHINIMCFVMYLNQQSNTYLPRSAKGKDEMISHI